MFFYFTEKTDAKKPRRVNYESYLHEVAEREKRKKQVLVCDDDLYRRKSLEDIRQLVQQVIGMSVAWKYICQVNEREKLVEIEIFDDKVDLIKSRDDFRPYGIYFKDNRTAREQEITNWLKQLARNERELGRNASAGYQKIYVDGVWKVWNDKRATLEVLGRKKRNN